jgi:acyl-CoA thioester hydrolase
LRTRSEAERRGWRLVVTEAGCRYRGNARYDEELSIRTRVTEIGHASVRFEYLLEATGRRLGEGFTVLASVDGDGKPTRLPQEIARLLRPN